MMAKKGKKWQHNDNKKAFKAPYIALKSLINALVVRFRRFLDRFKTVFDGLIKGLSILVFF